MYENYEDNLKSEEYIRFNIKIKDNINTLSIIGIFIQCNKKLGQKYYYYIYILYFK